MVERKIQKLYHLHIPKTGGRFIKDNFISPNISLFYKNGIKNYSGPSHANWDIDFIDEDTYIISSFRDPIERIVSDYAHSLVLDNSGNRIVDIGISTKMNRSSFIEWAKNNESYISDFQSKNLYIEDSRKNHIDCKEHFEFYFNEDSKKIVLEKSKRIDLFVKTNELEYNKVINKIFLDTGIVIPKINISGIDKYINIESELLYKSLTKEDIDYLQGINSLDYEILNTQSLFI